MPPKKRPKLNPGAGTDNENKEISGIESEISLSSPENPNCISSENDHESDGGNDMDLAECETRRTELLKDVQDLRSQFNTLRDQLHRERLQQIENQVNEPKAGTSVQDVNQLKLLEEEKSTRIEVASVVRQDEKRLVHDSNQNDLLETITELKEDKKKSGIARGKKRKGRKRRRKKKAPSRMKKAATVSGPYIVYMLRPEEIMEDWTAISKSCQNT